MIQNAGSGFQKQFADEPLLERLRYIATDPLADDEVKAKCNSLYRQWAVSYKNTAGMQHVATLYKQLPQRKKAPNKEQSKVLRETERPDDEDEDDHPRRTSLSTGSSSQADAAAALAERRKSSSAQYHSAAGQLSFAPAGYQPSPGSAVFPEPLTSKPKKDKKGNKAHKARPFNFEKERPQITQTITTANIEATGLLNAMKHIDRDKERVSANATVKKRFETCKALRRQTFRYCSLVTEESYLGTLLNANDQLSDALILYEQLDRSFDYDSDSEDYDDPDAMPRKGSALASPSTQQRFAGLSLSDEPQMPQRPTKDFNPTFTFNPPENRKGKAKDEAKDDEVDEEDEDDPFADRNAVNTPRIEKDEISW